MKISRNRLIVRALEKELTAGSDWSPGFFEKLRESFELIRSELARESWTDEVSETFGRIKAALEKKGQRIEDFDAAIAAHALARGATLVAANLDHMTRVPGLTVEDWSAGEPSKPGDPSLR